MTVIEAPSKVLYQRKTVTKRDREPQYRQIALSVKIYGDKTTWTVHPADARHVPDKIFWIHDDKGEAVGPDGTGVLGLWSSKTVRLLPQNGGKHRHGGRIVPVAAITSVTRIFRQSCVAN